MTGWGIAFGLIGTATIAACLYMAEHGYAWWQVLLMAVLGVLLMPHIETTTRRRKEGDE